MKTSIILFLLLIVSLVFCYYFYSELEKTKMDLVGTVCFSTAGFEEARIIPPSDAKSFAAEYKNTLSAPDSITGGIISRAAFDSLLCDSAVNAIAYVLAKDSTGTTGPGGNGVFLFLTGVNVTVNPTSGTIENVKPLKLPFYTPQHWCPPTCAAKY